MDALIKSLRPSKPSDVKSPDARPAELDPSEFLAAAVQRYHQPDATAGRTYRFNVTGYPAPQA